jgi:hypothetical protein
MGIKLQKIKSVLAKDYKELGAMLIVVLFLGFIFASLMIALFIKIFIEDPTSFFVFLGIMVSFFVFRFLFRWFIKDQL